MTRKLVSLTLAILFVPVIALAGQGERKDYQVFKDVARQIERYPRFTVFDDVNVSVDEGLVTLTGKVTMPFKRNDIGRLVAKIAGVTGVQNRLQVLPVSMFDDELRYRVAAAIYGNPNFWQYASMGNPPIHIVVEGGRVTLTGVVQSHVERMHAYSLATGLGAFSVENRLKTDAEVKAALEKIAE